MEPAEPAEPAEAYLGHTDSIGGQLAHPWQLCPVCWGSGIVPRDFYSYPTLGYPSSGGTTSVTSPETCQACGGRGIGQ